MQACRHLDQIHHLLPYDEFFATSILIKDGVFRGITAINMPREFRSDQGKACSSHGGLGTLYGFTTYSQTVTEMGSHSLPGRFEP